MNHRSVHLLDLPDELLLMIMEKLKRNDMLYSLLGVNERIDQLVGSASNTYLINFTSLSTTGDEHLSMDDEIFNRFCSFIMPQICYNVRTLILDHWSMSRVLFACEYPNLQTITFACFQPDKVLDYLKGISPIVRLFKTQIKNIFVVNISSQASNELLTDACAHIIALCTKLEELDMGGIGVNSKVSIYNRLPDTCSSSTLSILSIVVANFDDCLCLLDGRLNKLFSFSVKIGFIDETPSALDNTKTLSNLTVFSINAGVAGGYDSQVLPLLRRMPNLKNLTLCLNLIRTRFIDGIHLEKEILSRLSQLTTFIFHIRTIMPLIHPYHYASVDDIQNTFSHWKYGQVNCHVDYFSGKAGQCHIYSVPFQMRSINGVTNSFFGNSFPLVLSIRLFDERPFEHVYFNWIARAFPLLKYLTIDNMTPQEHKAEIESGNDNQKPIIYFPRLMTITLINAHIDYVHQFLRHTNSHVPCFSSLGIKYEQLVIATNNFTSDLTRVNCAQLKELVIQEEIVYPKQFYLYFPLLE